MSLNQSFITFPTPWLTHSNRSFIMDIIPWWWVSGSLGFLFHHNGSEVYVHSNGFNFNPMDSSWTSVYMDSNNADDFDGNLRPLFYRRKKEVKRRSRTEGDRFRLSFSSLEPFMSKRPRERDSMFFPSLLVSSSALYCGGGLV